MTGEEKLMSSSYSRRQALRALGGTSLGLLAAACGPAAVPASPTAPAAPTTAAAAKPAPTAATGNQPAAPVAAPKRGGQLRNGTNGEATNIHPLLRVDSDGDYLTDWIFDRVVDLNPKTLEPVPHLAKSWDVS